MQLHELLHQGEADARPLVRPAARPLDPVESLEDAGQFLGRDAGPGVADGQLRRDAGGSEADGDRPLEGELEGVGGEVQDDLLPHVTVHVNRLRQRWAVHDQTQPGLLAGGAEVAGQLRCQRRQVGRLVNRLHPAGLDPREVQEGVDQLQEPQAATVRRLQPLALPARQGLGGVGERVLDRAQDQGQRSAELVRGVGEEGGLRPVELREGLCPLLLLLVGPGVGDGGGDLAGDQLEEATVLVVEPQPRADAGHEQPRRLVGPPRGDGEDDGRGRAVGPGPRRDGPEAGRQVADFSEGPRPDRFRERPGGDLAAAEAHDAGADRIALGHAAGPRQGGAPAVGVEQVDQRERGVLVVRRQRPGRGGARLLGGLRLGGVRPEIAQDRHATLADDLLSDLMHGTQHPADTPRRVVVGHGAVGDREVGLLDVAVAVHLQEDVLHPRRRAAAEGRLDERADDVPDLRPALRGRLPHRSRVLGAEDRPRGVVVDLDVAGSPPEEELEAVDQEDPHHGAQRERPGLDGADRRRRPVDGAHQRAHLAAARQTVPVLVWGLHRKDPAPGRFIPVSREASFYPTEPAP